MGFVVLFLMGIILTIDVIIFRAASMYDREEEEELKKHEHTDT